MQIRTALACVLIALASSVAAEPTPAVKYLLKQQATLMDLGLMRLQAALERMVRLNEAEFTLAGQHPSVVAYYDEDPNLIRIEFMDTLAAQPALPAEEWSRICHVRFERLRALFKGESGPKSPLAQQFDHIGWGDGNRPFTLDAELRNMTVVRMFAQFADARSECSGRLVGTDVAVLAR